MGTGDQGELFESLACYQQASRSNQAHPDPYSLIPDPRFGAKKKGSLERPFYHGTYIVN